MKKKLFKLIRIFLLSIGAILILTIAILYFSLNEKLPEGKAGYGADLFALKIQQAVKHSAFKNTDYLQWSFRNKHHYIWDKSNESVEVKWDNYKVLLDLKKPDKSTVYEGDVKLEGNTQKIVEKALGYFNNDSFWLVAPYKLFDKGVVRKLVTAKDGTRSLLVTYKSGGTTPGDSYLWKVDEGYLPTSYKMWVSIIPIGGIEATWDGWITTDSGAYLAQKHRLLGFEIPITNVKAWNKK